MSSSTSTFATYVFQQVHSNINARRLLSQTPAYQNQAAATPPLSGNGASQEYTFDANVVLIVSVLLCALICSLGLHSFVRCTLRRSRLAASSESSTSSSSAHLADKGIDKKALKTLPIVNYTADLKLPGLDAECVICLSEYAPGERVKVLPKCSHGFHVRCIDRWLTSHSSCPTCRNCLIQTCQKIVDGSMPNTLLQESIINITVAPLEPEGVVRSYQS